MVTHIRGGRWKVGGDREGRTEGGRGVDNREKRKEGKKVQWVEGEKVGEWKRGSLEVYCGLNRGRGVGSRKEGKGEGKMC